VFPTLGEYMPDTKDKQKKENQERKPSLLNVFLTREKPDKTYFPELKEQWQEMGRKERVKFVLGGIVGLVFFVGALLLVYYVLVLIRG